MLLNFVSSSDQTTCFLKISKSSKRFNCENKEKSNLSITSYTGQMGKFIVINEAKNDGTRFIKAPNSKTMKYACDQAMKKS